MPVFLIIIGAILIFFNYKAIRKEDKSFSSIVKHKEENANEYDIQIAEMRKNFAESITELQVEILQLKEQIETLSGEKKDIYLDNKYEDKNNVEKSKNVHYNYKEENESTLIDKYDKNNESNGVISEIKFSTSNKTIKQNLSNIKKYTDKKTKAEKIEELINKGLTDDEICDQLKIGKGEVLLVKGLFKN